MYWLTQQKVSLGNHKHASADGYCCFIGLDCTPMQYRWCMFTFPCMRIFDRNQKNTSSAVLCLWVHTHNYPTCMKRSWAPWFVCVRAIVCAVVDFPFCFRICFRHTVEIRSLRYNSTMMIAPLRAYFQFTTHQYKAPYTIWVKIWCLR